MGLVETQLECHIDTAPVSIYFPGNNENLPFVARSIASCTLWALNMSWSSDHRKYQAPYQMVDLDRRTVAADQHTGICYHGTLVLGSQMKIAV